MYLFLSDGSETFFFDFVHPLSETLNWNRDLVFSATESKIISQSVSHVGALSHNRRRHEELQEGTKPCRQNICLIQLRTDF